MRERKVTEYITDAVFELLKTKKLPDITTSEIVKKAGVCRSSFYRNFYLPEDVLRQYINTIFEEIQQKAPITQGGMREHFQSVNACYLDHRERLTLLDKRGLLYLWEDQTTEYCIDQMRCMGLKNKHYQAEYYAGAMTHLLRAWIHNGFEESPQEITDIICGLVKWDILAERS